MSPVPSIMTLFSARLATVNENADENHIPGPLAQFSMFSLHDKPGKSEMLASLSR